jgi:trimethyllysine dioxygenase
MFHLLSVPGSHQGGKSILADGFRAAKLLRQSFPAYYDLLSTVKLPTHASGGEDTLITPLVARPVLEHDDYGNLVIVRWNADDRAAVGQGQSWQGTVTLDDGSTVDKVEGFYRAAQEWERLLRSEESQYWFQLEAGTPMSTPLSMRDS